MRMGTNTQQNPLLIFPSLTMAATLAGDVEEIISISLTPEERSALERSAAAVRELVDAMKKMP